MQENEAETPRPQKSTKKGASGKPLFRRGRLEAAYENPTISSRRKTISNHLFYMQEKETETYKFPKPL